MVHEYYGKDTDWKLYNQSNNSFKASNYEASNY